MILIEEGQHLTDLTLKSITIMGFRGRKLPTKIELSPSANFLIGKNGTGKTTLINIISDCLLCRYQRLMAAPFDSAIITFRSADQRHKPSLQVEKKYDKAGDVEEIRFSFTDYKTKGPSFEYSIKSRFYRRSEDFGGSVAQRRIVEEFQKRFRLTWLALNRSAGITKSSNEPSGDLDSRLEHSLQRLGVYFTRLDSRFSLELQNFQQQWFMALLVPSKRENALDIVNKLDAEEENRQIREMLSGIGIKANQFSSKVDRHVQAIRKLNEINSTSRPEIELIADSNDISKLHFLVDLWLDLQKTKEGIYRTREKFINIANSMLYKKTVSVDSGNRVLVRKVGTKSLEEMEESDLRSYRRELAMGKITQPGEIRYSDLSSGEKQLLIFLSETALRSESPYIFIADEPELSLHIDWQEKLVPVILDLSPYAQVLFATHSPDIVNQFRNNVFSMEGFVD